MAVDFKPGGKGKVQLRRTQLPAHTETAAPILLRCCSMKY